MWWHVAHGGLLGCIDTVHVSDGAVLSHSTRKRAACAFGVSKGTEVGIGSRQQVDHGGRLEAGGGVRCL